MKLIITEKPSVGRDIARVLNIPTKKQGYIEGNGYLVSWAFGHLIELSQPDQYNDNFKQWVLEDLPIIPEKFKTKIIEKSKDQFEVIKTLCQHKELTEVICATDAGREGELIFRLIYEEAQCKAPIKRLWISSQTDKAIQEGFKNLKPGNDYNPLFDSARSRSEADWIVGINATRAYSIKFSRGHGVMSVGRVQTPVLKMIVDRYRAHSQFESKPFYEILVDIKHQNGNFETKWFTKETDRLNNKEDAEIIVNELKNTSKGTITSLTEKQVNEKQPLLYDLTEIQKEANRQFKFSADQTLTIMQALYETHKLLTYPRTSSRYLSKDVAATLPNLLNQIKTLETYEPYVTTIQKNNWTMAKRMIDDKKVTDHHAIIPTDKKPHLSSLTDEQKKIYDLVLRRFIASFYPECEKHHTEIIVSFEKNTCKTTGTVTKKNGWRELYLHDKKEEQKKDKKNNELTLPIVAKNDPVTHTKVNLKKGQTKAPPLHTEASILASMETAGKTIDDEELRQAMKNCGLGTPATRAQILEKLINIKVITREKNKLTPTSKGEYLIDSIQSEELLSPELTGQWEKKLNDMAQGEGSREDYMTQIKIFTKNVIKTVSESQIYAIRADQKVYGSCPKCKLGKIIEAPKSYSCTHWKSHGCKFALWKTMAQKNITESHLKSLLKKGKTSLIKGFKSKAGNSFDAALALIDGEIKFDFQKESIGSCPLCEGHIVETPKAFSCDKWRETGCKFTIWKEISRRTIKKTEAKSLLKHHNLKNIEGFKSSSGTTFNADLIIKNDRVQLEPIH